MLKIHLHRMDVDYVIQKGDIFFPFKIFCANVMSYILTFLLLFGPAHGTKSFLKSGTCSALQNAEFWSDGHTLVSCSDGTNIGSVCSIKCDEPYVSFKPDKPHSKWNVECKNSTWVASDSARPTGVIFVHHGII